MTSIPIRATLGGMKSFKLKVTLDPAKHNVPHHVAKQHEHGYTCGCIVSQAVNDALLAQGARFRRWASAYPDTGIVDTQIHVTYADGRKGRRYEAKLPKAFYEARLAYDNNRSGDPEHQQPIVGATRTLTFVAR